MDTTTDSTRGSLAAALSDTVIIGGGAAGLSAGVVLARARFAPLLVDFGEPRNGPADHMHGCLIRDGMAPGEGSAAAVNTIAWLLERELTDAVSPDRLGAEGAS